MEKTIKIKMCYNTKFTLTSDDGKKLIKFSTSIDVLIKEARKHANKAMTEYLPGFEYEIYAEQYREISPKYVVPFRALWATINYTSDGELSVDYNDRIKFK